jgi:MraZ protein
VYADEDWKAFEAKLASLPLINEEARQFARYFLSGAQYVTVDKQGRILMPQDLREFAGLEKDVVLAGTGGRIEIWSLEKWNENNSQVDIGKISQSMVNLGLTI